VCLKIERVEVGEGLGNFMSNYSVRYYIDSHNTTILIMCKSYAQILNIIKVLGYDGL
jgi:hypothetical protein